MRRFGLALLFLAACGGPDPATSGRSPDAEKWYSRAKQSYRQGDVEDASQAIGTALNAASKDPEVRLLAARIALSKLEYAEALKLTEGLQGSEAKGIRGRSFWYAGDIERAADELEEMLRDPNVKDPWARDVSKLARRGHGRHPFQIEGGVVAAVDMPSAGAAMVVPCELDGERILALVATNFGELMIDSTTRREPAWVNLRFAELLEVKDVPALTHDLSGVSRQLGAPIKALFGVNLLRHMHVTFDRRGSQFVVRKNEPSAPPNASRMPIFYARGGAMLLRGSISSREDGQALLFVDSSAFYPVALDDALLKKSGADLSTFKPDPNAPPSWKVGTLPYFRLGGVDLAQFPAMQGAPLADIKQTFDVDLGGVIGAGLLQLFRVTFADEGRVLWMEPDPLLLQPMEPRRPEQAPPSGDVAPPPAPSTPAAPTTPAPAPEKKPVPSAEKKPSGPVSESKGAAK